MVKFVLRSDQRIGMQPQLHAATRFILKTKATVRPSVTSYYVRPLLFGQILLINIPSFIKKKQRKKTMAVMLGHHFDFNAHHVHHPVGVCGGDNVQPGISGDITIHGDSTSVHFDAHGS